MKLFPKDKLVTLAFSGRNNLAALAFSWRNDLTAFKEEKTIKLANLVYLGTLLLSVLLALLTLKRLPPQVPLFYSLPWGDEQLASPFLLFLLPLGCLLFGSLNLFLAIISFASKPLAARILVWFNVVFTLLATLTLLRIIMLVI